MLLFFFQACCSDVGDVVVLHAPTTNQRHINDNGHVIQDIPTDQSKARNPNYSEESFTQWPAVQRRQAVKGDAGPE